MISDWMVVLNFLVVCNGLLADSELMLLIGAAVSGLFFFKFVHPARRALQVFSVSLS